MGLFIGVVCAGVGVYFYVDRTSTDAMLQESTFVEPGVVSGESRNEGALENLPNIADLQRLIQHKNPLERAVAVQAAVAGAGKDELNGLLTNTDSIQPASFRHEIQDSIVRQLALLDPNMMLKKVMDFAKVRRHRLIEVVFEEWSVLDLDESIRVAQHMEEGNQVAALKGILGSRIDLSDQRRREIAQQLNNDQLILDQWALANSQDSIADPAAEWSDFLQFHGRDVEILSLEQRSLLVNIAQSWIGRDGFGEMTREMNESLDDYDTCVTLIELLLDEVVSEDPRVVMEAAGTMGPEVRSIVMQALTKLADKDPLAAFRIASMMEANGSQIALQRAALEGWIESDPKAVLETRTTLPETFREWIEHSALMSMVRTLPEEVPSFIPDISDQTQLELVVTNLALNWARKDPKAVFEWLQSEPKAHQWYGNVLSNVIQNLTRTDPEEAFRFALEQPPREYDGLGWEVSVVRTVAQTDVDTAIALTDRARDEESRDSMFQSIGGVLIYQGQYQRALDWAEHLKEDQLEDHYSRLVNTWASGNPEQLYEKIDELPLEEARKQAAELLVLFNDRNHALTAEQIEELREYLPVENGGQLQSE